MWIDNAWYMAGWSSEIGEELFTRTLLNNPIVFYRRESNNALVALMDICPHRFAPLSLGCIVNDNIRCNYHALEFNNLGACVKNPLGSSIPKAAKVRAFPVHEQEGMVWIWMGENEPDDTSVIPRFEYHTDPDFRFVTGTTYTKADYRLFIDNLMDLSHTYTVHPGLGGMDYIPKTKSWKNDDGSITQEHIIKDMPNFLGALMPTDTVTHCDTVTWVKPASQILNSRTTGGDVEIYLPSAHILTPETEGTSHYFWSSGVEKEVGISNEELLATLNQAFNNEDKPMIEGTQQRMGNKNLWDLAPVLSHNDSGMVRVRRKIEKIIKQENK